MVDLKIKEEAKINSDISEEQSLFNDLLANI